MGMLDQLLYVTGISEIDRIALVTIKEKVKNPDHQPQEGNFHEGIFPSENLLHKVH